MAYIFQYIAGDFGAIVVNLGVIISLAGATLGYTIIASECPYIAAKNGVFPKIFAKSNKKNAPVTALFLTNAIIQLFLIITYVNASTYQIFYTISASMILIPYLLSCLYFFKISFKKETFAEDKKSTIFWCRLLGALGSVYGLWLMYSSGLESLLITTILYAPGSIVYYLSKKEQGQKSFKNLRDKLLLVLIVALAITSLALIFLEKIKPF